MTTAKEMPRCQTCAWWAEGAPALAYAVRALGQPEGTGACQYNPPTVVVDEKLGPSAFFPVTHRDRHCFAWDPIVDDDGPDDGERAEDADVVVPFRSAA